MFGGDDKPTAKQLRFCQHLGVRVPRGASKWDVSSLIDEALAKGGRRQGAGGSKVLGCLGMLVLGTIVVTAIGSRHRGPPVETPAALAVDPPSVMPTVTAPTKVEPSEPPRNFALERSMKLAHLRITSAYRDKAAAVVNAEAKLAVARNGGQIQDRVAAGNELDAARAAVVAMEEKALEPMGK
jgi:hypothetical protein